MRGARLGFAKTGLAAGIVAVGLALPGAAFAQTFEVDRFDDPLTPGACTPAPNDCSLGQAAQKADADAAADLISLGPGEYVTSQVSLEETTRVVGAGARQTIVRSTGGFFTDHEFEHFASYELADMTLTGAVNEGPKYGGALLVEAPTTLRRMAIVGNEDGAAKYKTQLYPAWGGGIYAYGELTVEDSLIAQNTANAGFDGTSAYGAGIYFASGSIGRVRNTTIVENIAIGGSKPATGGGIAVGSHSFVKLENVTMAASIAKGGAGSGGGNLAIDPEATVTARGTIIAKGLPTAVGSCSGPLLSLGGNVEDGTGCGLSAADRSSVDPLLGPLADNGGPTNTMALISGSPAIDFAGTCAIAADQRGVARPSAACDSGAFELQQPAPRAAACSMKVSGTVAKLVAQVTCDQAATISISGTATIAAGGKKAQTSARKKKKPKAVTLVPTATSTAPSGVATKVGLTLPRSVRTAVRKGKRVSLSLKLTARTAAGVSSTASAQVKKVRKPPRKKRR
jgi:hypothetical protein